MVRETMPKTGTDLRVLRIGPSTPPVGAAPQTAPLVQTTFAEDNGEISPDGHWLAYQSNESGQLEISVRPFPNVDRGHWTISTSGGTRPLWARSGKELFYLDGANAITSVPIQTAPTFSAGNPTTLFGRPYFLSGGDPGRSYDVSPDSQRFLMIKTTVTGDQTSTSPSMVVVLNWFEELKARPSAK
jgi:serine/threonine-protein kinase